ncbi:AMP-dependent synthetase/ligase [Nocardia barduliensis]|uniref:AMP-dependent synthetase/ligase n=1 Tax=Nocardia barduliensis TaxID=2736643 RepID=UPI001573F84C|nr:AMP-dependent synthetase/ligase [Nocardia barduliensis]
MTTARHDEIHQLLTDARSVCDLLRATADKYPDHIALRSYETGVEWTYRQAITRIGAVAERLRELGVARGDTVALMMRNIPQFHIVDAAVMMLGAVPFSVYNTSPAEDVRQVLTNAGARVAIAESGFVPVLRRATEVGAPLGQLLAVDAAAEDGQDLLAELAAEETGFDFGVADEVGPDDLLTLIYTSGTTGPSKGVELTHAGMLTQLRGIHAVHPLDGHGRQISFLSAAHVADRWTSHYSAFMTYANTLTCVADAANLPACVAEIEPTVFGAVPRVWEKFKTALELQFSGDLLAEVVADPSLGQRLLQRLGLGSTRWAVTGAAPTPRAVIDFFVTLGLPLCELLGMSETSCAIATNTPDDLRPGSVGRALPGVEVALAPDGELLVRGPQLMRGYRGQPEKTAEAIDAEGWLHTGDIASIEDGTIWIIDRKKELLITSGGKNLSPANIEMAVRSAGNLISQVCAIGDGLPYVVALVVVDPAAAGASDTSHGLYEQVNQQIQRANTTLARVSQIKKFKILDSEWTPGAELTPTLKLRRAAILDKYATEIAELYTTNSVGVGNVT